MATGSTKRIRSGRVGGFALPPGHVSRTLQALRSREVLIRLGLCLLAAGVMWAATGAWAPPFSYRSNYIPRRDIAVRTSFKVFDRDATDKQRKQQQQETPWIFENDPGPVRELRERLKEPMLRLMRSESYDKIDDAWKEFSALQSDPSDGMGADRSRFETLHEALKQDKDLMRFDAALNRVMSNWESDGLLVDLTHLPAEGSHAVLMVYPKGNPALKRRVEVNRVRIDEVRAKLPDQLRESFSAGKFSMPQADVLAEVVSSWLLKQGLPTTLRPNTEQSLAEIEKVLSTVQVDVDYPAGKVIAKGGDPLDDGEIFLLRKEHEAYLANLTIFQRIGYSLATFGMYGALYVLCGFYIVYRKPRLISDLRRFGTLLFVIVATVALSWIAAADAWRAEIIPLLIFGMTVAIAYEKELALLLSASVSLVVAFSLEQGLGEFVILTSSVAAAVLFLGRIRSRTKLIYVAMFTGAVVMLTAIGVGTLAGQAFGLVIPGVAAPIQDSFLNRLLVGAGWFGLCSLLAGLLMTGLLPFIERMFEVQTDISLLELGDAAHPLLQELVRRAPGTYNHSINVASIGEAAAEAIGANGLLVRVGAYFHDIGKMLKPQYFVENQGGEGNRHESLAPAMSTLVIIAHVKDGIDLARQHRLPETIVDFIAQHHGTTLVEYFYRRAAKQLENDPDAAEIDEANFRYPGPKPQTKETAVLMLADVVESASRALVDPAPARIESLVHDLAMKRLLDGQFDECGLTLQELHLIEESLVKSVTAVYHGRVKYPEHQTV
jgi:cyclic-di-AMP phosphodiesterase PgpH